MKKMFVYLKLHSFMALNIICVIFMVLSGMIYLGIILSDAKIEQTDRWERLDPDQINCFEDEAFAKAVFSYLDYSEENFNEEYFKKMDTLIIAEDNEVTFISDLVLFPNLTTLVIKDCMVSDIEPIVHLKELKVLDLSGNKIVNLEPIYELEKLEEINLSNNKINHVTNTLFDMSQLKKVNLSENRIESLPNMPETSSVEELNVSKNNLKSLSFLEKNCSIKILDISYNSIKSISQLKMLPLEALYMYGYSDMDLSILEQMDTFHSIFLSESFDHSKVDFMVNNFRNADRYTKAYLIRKSRGFDE